MRNLKVFVVGVFGILAGCGDELAPKLDLDGHWHVDHGVPGNGCQVSATISDELLALSLISTIDDACLPEFDGMGSQILPIQIDGREDDFNDSGAVSAELRLSSHQRQISGEITLTETVAGLSGIITAVNDPSGRLPPIEQPTYHLSRMSEDWLPLAKGAWATQCNQLVYLEDVSPDELCEIFQVIDATKALISVHRGTTAGSAENTVNSSWETATLVVRNVEKTGDFEYTLDLVILPLLEVSISMEVVMVVSEGAMTLTMTEEDEIMSLDLFPVAQ